jgi:hypothetical protein
MRRVLQRTNCVVIDDFLPAARLRAARAWFETQPFKFVHVPEVAFVFRVGDGNPLNGSTFIVPVRPIQEFTTDGKVPEARALSFYLYPTETLADRILESIIGEARKHAEIVGREGRDWVAMSGRPYIYPMGAGLGWHDDGTRYAGAFILYLHPSWDPDWGGELMVSEGRRAVPPRTNNVFGVPAEKSQLLQKGFGSFILPKPNRLVLLQGGTAHRVSPVTVSAGNHVRASISGFFFREQSLREILG